LFLIYLTTKKPPINTVKIDNPIITFLVVIIFLEDVLPKSLNKLASRSEGKGTNEFSLTLFEETPLFD
jgi:hypothetical protein